MSENLIVYVTDIHGDDGAFEKALKKAKRAKAKALIIGGDLNSYMTLMAVNGIELQRMFLELYLLPLIERFKKETKIEVFIMMGNDDYSINMDLLEKSEKRGILKVMHNKTHKLGAYTIVGFSNINPSEYLVFPINDWVMAEGKIKSSLETLTRGIGGKNMILVAHPPPVDTTLDILYDGTNVGSIGLREFIEKKQPLLGLHGHIHESPTLSGNIKDTIGRTLSVNPGNAKPIVIDLDGLKIKS